MSRRLLWAARKPLGARKRLPRMRGGPFWVSGGPLGTLEVHLPENVQPLGNGGKPLGASRRPLWMSKRAFRVSGRPFRLKRGLLRVNGKPVGLR